MKENLELKTGLTCLACKLVFADAIIQKQHYAKEWHRYNIKRHVANLPPINEATFLEKSHQIELEREQLEANKEVICSHCHKKFKSSKALENHLNSRKHKENIQKLTDLENNPSNQEPKKIGEPISKSIPKDINFKNIEDELNENYGIPIGDCLFCSSSLNDFDSSMKHMSKEHGFLIPDINYCSDILGLIKYLGLKIGAGKTCIFCNSYRFRDLDAVQKHMRDKNHCNFRIDDRDLVEFVDFYDYSEDNDFEDLSTLVNVMKKVFESCSVNDDAYFITIPTGLSIGHRSLMRYFKQSFRPNNNVGIKTSTNRSINSGIKQIGQLTVKLTKNANRITNRLVQNYQLKKGLANNRIFVSCGRKDQM
ncbi:C2H2-type domain-containing protein [Meloidogyne graminicola]|uniref:C2H2-type domain-containing protein n=1 Tax=Meloidogyne graminicola TaxID=189291 RepID=A0A8S9ZX73_9BILA|nr:C2H2-type domain-containing protein [Meloidogyne graminicola]